MYLSNYRNTYGCINTCYTDCRYTRDVPERDPLEVSDDDDLNDLKNEQIVVPVTAKTKRIAKAKADSQGRTLAMIVRAWVMGWASGELPDPPNFSDSVHIAPKRKKAPARK